MRVWPGRPYPLGATWDGNGVNFSLFSEHATGVELCLFRHADDATPIARIPMRERTDLIWHAWMPDVRPGQLYGYHVNGPYAPQEGHRFNPHKLLLDPYARAVSGSIAWSDLLYAYPVGADDLTMDDRDSAGAMPKCVVVDEAFSWGDDRHPRVPWNHTIIYETHVKGLTMRHPDVPKELRGTYLGLAWDPVVDHLLGLGVTAIELLPVQQFVVDRPLADRGLTNYWGYNTLSFFAPDVRYATAPGQQVEEFKTMVKTLHRHGLEVILDVVYNHTGEGNHLGPTVSFRGIDNHAYYRLVPEDPRFYVDWTGCGNSINMPHPRTLQLVMDSLRYWVTQMHVDGFRFDLAATLARDPFEFERASRFFETIGQDPVLSQVKLIAEPWDLGPHGHRLGRFPVGWAEWNDAYRDSVRRFWRGEGGMIPELASRLSGSSDIFAPGARRPHASINFVTAHDGFTLHDLVSYERKHNEANGEDNTDGIPENLSRNWGAEGPTESARIVHIRERMKRNFLATLVFSQGVAMILGGDEVGRTQDGNNNAYCQDNEISWYDWDLDANRRSLLEFTRGLLQIFRENPTLRRRSFFTGRRLPGDEAKDVSWIRPDGQEMTDADWRDPSNHVLGMLMPRRSTDEVDERGRPIFGDTLLLLVNGGGRSRFFTLPRLEEPATWEELVNTARPGGGRPARRDGLHLVAHSLILLRAVAPG